MLLLVLFGLALSIGMGVVMVVLRRCRGNPSEDPPRQNPPGVSHAGVNRIAHAYMFRRPGCWLAVKCTNPVLVQKALALHNPKPCSWVEGMAGEEKLFIAPPIKGWILVIGSGLPEPSEDVDVCFRFLMNLSRKLGQVQFFSASRVLHNHAWVKVERGRVLRAYAWAGRTLWNQGARTATERELGLRCFGYTEAVQQGFDFSAGDPLACNVDKVPLLAARWSLDPARIDESCIENESGIAGEPSHRF